MREDFGSRSRAFVSLVRCRAAGWHQQVSYFRDRHDISIKGGTRAEHRPASSGCTMSFVGALTPATIVISSDG